MGVSESSRRAGRHTVTPRIITPDPQGLVDFLHQVFGAEGEYQPERPTELWLGDSLVMISDGGGVWEPVPAYLLVYVEDTDAVYQRAITFGATSLEDPTDQPWGDRRATVLDSWGNTWQIATVVA
jgi:PhnB protein